MSEQSLKERWRQTPHSPGVYIMKDDHGGIIYVGKARDLHKRLANYFSPSRATLADHKTRALIHSIVTFDYYETKNEQEALLLESKFIKDYRPKYNIQFRDDKRFPIIRIPKGEPFPRFELTRLRKEDGSRYFGPFPHSAALNSTIEWLNKEFHLRSCKVKFPDEKTFKHCNADIIRNCSAPCMKRISEEDYAINMQEAVNILEGTGKKAILEKLETAMWLASESHDFEQAALLRDTRDNLIKILEPTRKFQKGAHNLPSTVNPEADLAELGEQLGLAQPPNIIECFDISNVSSNHIVASMVRFTHGKPDNKAYRRYRIKDVEGQNDFASMAEVIRRRYSRILRENHNVQECPEGTSLYTWLKQLRAEGRAPIHVPDLVVVDGGKGQLSIAVHELTIIGLQDMPIVGLAKQHEEIFFPNNPTSLRIPHHKGALKLLQRLRDESHRFANNYNELLLRKRITESLLDDAPGVTPRKKMLLLQKFKTLSNIKKTTAKDIAGIPGISEAWAEKLLTWLRES